MNPYRLQFLARLVLAALVCIALFPAQPAVAQTAPDASAPQAAGDLLWEDHVNPAGQYDTTFAVAEENSRVYVTGAVTVNGNCEDTAPSNCDFYLRAYDALTGAPLWEEQVDKVGGQDLGIAVAAREGVVAAVGAVSPDTTCLFFSGSGNCDFYVRAYDGVSGAVLWEDQRDIAGGHDVAFTVAIWGGRVFAAGLVTNAAGDTDFLVRAYEAATGALLWQDQFDQGGDEAAFSLVARGGRVFAAGITSGDATCEYYPTPGNCDWFVRAYSGATGAVVWDDQLDLAGGHDSVNAIAASGGMVYAAGWVSADTSCDYYNTNAGDCDFYVRAYTATGAVVWEDQFDMAEGTDVALSLDVSQGRMYAVGRVTNAAGNEDLIVRAYDATTGAVLWNDVVDKAGDHDRAYSVVARGNRVFVGGSTIITSNYNWDFLLRAYDGATGVLMWEDVVDKAGGYDDAYSLAVGAGRVFVAGSSTNLNGDRDFLVRAYAAK